MSDEDRIAELLLRWEKLQEQGPEPSADDLCRDCPQLAALLARRIQALKATAWMEDDRGGGDDGIQPDPPVPSSPRTLAGRYRLDEKIAEGGFSIVWKAHDLELGREVAVKLPRRDRLHSAEGFVAEARRVARLKHPGVVPVFDVGKDGDTVFIVSEFVEGGSLAQRIAMERIPTQESVRLVAEVAETLAYAHKQGFVHRDIKPGNVLLDHHGRALLADFGIARSPEEGSAGDAFGTLAYMAPEQVEGRAADRRSDIYGLGVVLYELLTGEPPHRADDPVELRRKIVSEQPDGIPDRAAPPDIVRICLKCLRREPGQRHQDAAELAQELRRARLDRGSFRMGRGVTAGLALAALALVGWTAFGLLPPLPTPDRQGGDQNGERLAVEQPTGVRRAVEWVYSVGGTINDAGRPDELPEPWAVRSVYLHRDRVGGRVADADLGNLAGLPDLETLNLGGAKIDGGGLAHMGASGKLSWLSLEGTQVNDAGAANLASFPHLTYLNLLSTPVTDASVGVLLKLARLKTLVVSGTRMSPSGLERLRRGMPSCRVVCDDGAALEAALALGRLHAERKRWKDAEAAYTEAIRLEGNCAEAYRRRGGCRFNAGRAREALADLDTAVRLDPKNAEAFKDRGVVNLNLRRPDEALADLHTALKLAPGNPAPTRKVLGETYGHRGYLRSQKKEWEGADADFTEAIRHDPANAGYFDRRGSVRFNLKRYEEARKDFSEAIRLDPRQPAYYMHRGFALEALGRKDEAAEDFRRGKGKAP